MTIANAIGYTPDHSLTRRWFNHFFLAGADLAAAAADFAATALVSLACFWPAFLSFDFGDLSPMVFFGCR